MGSPVAEEAPRPSEASRGSACLALPGSGATLPEAAQSQTSSVQHGYGCARRVNATVHPTPSGHVSGENKISFKRELWPPRRFRPADPRNRHARADQTPRGRCGANGLERRRLRPAEIASAECSARGHEPDSLLGERRSDIRGTGSCGPGVHDRLSDVVADVWRCTIECRWSGPDNVGTRPHALVFALEGLIHICLGESAGGCERFDVRRDP